MVEGGAILSSAVPLGAGWLCAGDGMTIPTRTFLTHLSIGLLLVGTAPAPLLAQGSPPPAADDSAAQGYSPEQLDALLAPVALYPDALLTQTLMATAYPLQVVEASRWVDDPANKGLTGPALDQALAAKDWDPSVKSLVPFPQVLAMLNTKLDWTQQVGWAMGAQQADVWASVQRLRQQAYAAGNLRNTDQQVVTTQDQAIVIEPAQPNVVYVPVYNPTVVYGTWAYPAYPPVYLPPPPGYAVGAAIFAGFAFGAAVAINNSLWGWARPHWGYGGYGGGYVNVNVNRYNTININRPPINNSNWRPGGPGYRPPGGGYKPPPGPVGPPHGGRPGGNGGGLGPNNPGGRPGGNGGGGGPNNPGNRPGGNGGGLNPNNPGGRPGGSGGGQGPNNPGNRPGGNGGGLNPNNPSGRPGGSGGGQGPNNPGNRPGGNGGGLIRTTPAVTAGASVQTTPPAVLAATGQDWVRTIRAADLAVLVGACLPEMPVCGPREVLAAWVQAAAIVRLRGRAAAGAVPSGRSSQKRPPHDRSGPAPREPEMTYLGAAAVVALSTALAVFAAWLVGRLTPLESCRRHHEVGSAVFQQVGVMISVLLAFVFSEVWGEYRTAALAINGECAALHGAAILANAVPDGQGLPVVRAIAAYAQTVVTTEWPTMAQRHRSAAAAHALGDTIRAAARMDVSRPVDLATQNEILSLLAQAHANRETRTFQITQGMPGFMWLMIIAISVALVGFVVFSGAEAPAHIVLSGVFAASTALVLVLVRMLDYPFEGALAIPDTDFVKMLGEVTALAAGAGR